MTIGTRVKPSALAIKRRIFLNNVNGVAPADRRGTIIRIGRNGRTSVHWDTGSTASYPVEFLEEAEDTKEQR